MDWVYQLMSSEVNPQYTKLNLLPALSPIRIFRAGNFHTGTKTVLLKIEKATIHQTIR